MTSSAISSNGAPFFDAHTSTPATPEPPASSAAPRVTVTGLADGADGTDGAVDGAFESTTTVSMLVVIAEFASNTIDAWPTTVEPVGVLLAARTV